MTRRGAALLVLALLAAGCGPIEYVNTVTRGADSAVDAARAANAVKWSPYWWTRAVEYLHQARIEAASADFQAANRFGRLAEEAAQKATSESLRCAAKPEDCAFELPTGPNVAPVDDDDETPPDPDHESKGGLAPIEDDE